ncbi:LysR substrate-binding domain-containing protein [Halomonas sp. KO116]|uniref:LysR substrate-binding domain-containing protein n=1 Tax=Halomonas sp. KO116 TaxID=1504981 RepID=UPI0004E30013|nr:LysR substrate-binding domain-containing protein [Halomonas sp. KO116]AJY52329.1 transcriptional regulator, LysR family [Halomonas sp. KO116]
MQLRQLHYFSRIVEEGSFSRASQSLHIAQPALSQQINRLEEELGVKLLTRSVRGVLPTQAGLAVHRHAQLILKQVAATPTIAAIADSGPAGPVAVGLPPTIATSIGLKLLKVVSEQFKAIQLEIVEGPSQFLANLLSQGKIDISIIFDVSAKEKVKVKPLVSEPLLFVGKLGTIKTESTLSLYDISSYPLLLFSRPNGIREAIEAAFASDGLTPKIVAEINSPNLLINAVQAGMGYSIIPSLGLDQAKEKMKLDVIRLSNPNLNRTVFLGTSDMTPLMPATQEICRVIEELIYDSTLKNDHQ